VEFVGLCDNKFLYFEISEKELSECDMVIITTDHTSYDIENIVKKAPLVLDTRNATKNIKDAALREKIVLLGSGVKNTN